MPSVLLYMCFTLLTKCKDAFTLITCSNIVIFNMTSAKLKQIAVNESNYQALKELGHAGDSFNDVITQVLKKVRTGAEGVAKG